MTNVPHRASGASESRISEKPRCHIGIVAKKGATNTDRGRIHGPQPQQMRSQPSAIDTPRTASVERLAARREPLGCAHIFLHRLHGLARQEADDDRDQRQEADDSERDDDADGDGEVGVGDDRAEGAAGGVGHRALEEDGTCRDGGGRGT